MKNNLSKTKTVIILFLVTVIFLSFYAFVITRPVSYGLAYHSETVYEGYHFEGKIKLYKDGIMLIENSSFDEPLESYYYYKDGYVVSLMETEEEKRQAEIELIEENIEDFFPFKVNAFVYTSKGINEELPMTYACKSIFVFAVFGGVFALALIGFSCLSLILSIRAKRSKKEVTKHKLPDKSGYEQQQRLSTAQILAEVPSFIAVLVSAILSRNLLVFIDLFDSFMYLISLSLVVVLSKKLTKDLHYEYNYGVGKIEIIASLFCDGIAFLGLLIALGLSVYEITFPNQPSDLVIAVVGLKAINVSFDAVFFAKQRKITKLHNSAISNANYAEAVSALLFDSVAFVSLFAVWLLRDNPVGGYISPVVSVFVAIYLMFGYVKRTRQALTELTDKTLPEEEQMKMLSILTRYYDNYSQFHSINSHKSGDITIIDLHLSFEKNTRMEEVVKLKKQMQADFGSQLGNCAVNIVVEED